MLDLVSHLFFSGVAAKVNAEKFEIVRQMQGLGAVTPRSAIPPSRISYTKSAFRSLKGRKIINETRTGLIYLDESRLNKVAGASNKFIILSIVVMLGFMFMLFWLQFKA